MAGKRLLIPTLVVACAAIGCTHPNSKLAKPDSKIGLVEHRGNFYQIENLMDPTYTVKSDDPFVKQFSSNEQFASPWAGLSSEEMSWSSKYYQAPEPCRSPGSELVIPSMSQLLKSGPQ